MSRIAFTAALLLLSLCANAFTLVIDAGHGGRDGGAKGRFSKEKNINLAVALALGRLVEDNCKDVKVIYTRKTDVFVELDERANIANRAKADLFISIHTNSTASKVGPRGAETYTLGMHRAADNLEVAKRENSVITLESNYEQKYEGFDPNSSESYIIFELMQDQNMAQSVKLARKVQEQFRSTAGQGCASGRLPGAEGYQHAQCAGGAGLHQQSLGGDIPQQPGGHSGNGQEHLPRICGIQEVSSAEHQVFRRGLYI